MSTIAKFVNVNGKSHFVLTDPEQVIREYATLIRANAVRASKSDQETYRDLVQLGCCIAIETASTHLDEMGPLSTRMAWALMGIRSEERKQAVFESTFGAPVELDNMFDAEGDWDNSEIYFSEDESPASFDIPEPMFEGDEPDDRSAVLNGMIVPEDMAEKLLMVANLPDAIFLLMVIDWLTGAGRSIEVAANAIKGVEEHDLPLPKWTREMSIPEYAEDQDSVDTDGLNDDHGERTYGEYWEVVNGKLEHFVPDEPFEDQDFITLGDVEIGRYVGAVGFGMKERSVHNFKHQFVTVTANDIGTDMSWENVQPESQAELDFELDKLGWHLPMQFQMEHDWNEFVSKLTEHTGTHLSVAYQAGVARATLNGYGMKEAVEVGKEMHRIAIGQARLSGPNQVYVKKVAPKGATVEFTQAQKEVLWKEQHDEFHAEMTAPKEGTTMKQIAIEVASTNGAKLAHALSLIDKRIVPNRNAWLKAKATHAPEKVKILLEKDVVEANITVVWATIPSSQNGPKPYRVIMGYMHDGAGARHIVGAHCTCAAGEVEQPCYHVPAVAFAVQMTHDL